MDISLVTAWVDEGSVVRALVELGVVVGDTACEVAEIVGDVVTGALVETLVVARTDVEDGGTETELEEAEAVTGSEVTTVLEETVDEVLGASVVVAFDPTCLFANSIIAFAFATSTKACATAGCCL